MANKSHKGGRAPCSMMYLQNGAMLSLSVDCDERRFLLDLLWSSSRCRIGHGPGRFFSCFKIAMTKKIDQGGKDIRSHHRLNLRWTSSSDIR